MGCKVRDTEANGFCPPSNMNIQTCTGDTNDVITDLSKLLYGIRISNAAWTTNTH